ncbi:PliI family lysozyme inhibitor of I-type lysozyme [Gloeobacter morelensis]|uniref:PliI family lysozyme inhibitor of I-type lysozyme n=1 Tax=Gloeobacter morelensis MG652769 TaxID=2781736 RepID=A0ABY3PNI0_9CYAN|nr:PliI family lysozyme inhibitor of I-type lysozyme [Gloeobacter morelensis]UFP95258.1 PliI family lysozyme inhibitor of I-type lysozyme [Gloeobacter morelensis MG652769]
MKALLACVLAGLLLGTTLAAAGAAIRQEQIQFEKGKTSTIITGKLKGDQIVDYQLRASAGQSMATTFKPSNLSAYFNVLPPGSSDVAIFVGSVSGNRFKAELPTDGVYTIRVYLMRSAARRNETANYTLEVGIAGRGKTAAAASKASPVTGLPFDRTLELQGIRFHVTSANEGSANTLRIVPANLEIDNSPIERTINGTVTGAEVADLNVDGSPEIYIYITSAGSGSYGSLVAYSVNRRKSLSEVYLPPLTQDKVASKGYMGQDEFAVVESALVQRFPVYRDTDTNAKPTGSTRQLQYKLVPGEASWILKVDRVVEY